MASHAERLLNALQYAYPAVVFTYYILATIFAVANLQNQHRKSKTTRTWIRHRGIVALTACLTATYIAEALTLIINGFFNGSWPADGLVVGSLYCVVVFGIQLA